MVLQWTNLSSAAAKNGLEPSKRSISTVVAPVRFYSKIKRSYRLSMIWMTEEGNGDCDEEDECGANDEMDDDDGWQ